jgi:cell division protein FtsB
VPSLGQLCRLSEVNDLGETIKVSPFCFGGVAIWGGEGYHWGMNRQLFRKRPVLSFPQIVVLLIVLGGLMVALDLNRRAALGGSGDLGEVSLQEEIGEEATRQVELQATLVYVQSDDYVAAYARQERGMLQPGEQRVVPLLITAVPLPTPLPPEPPDPAHYARPWQAWWQLLTDTPQPSPTSP